MVFNANDVTVEDETILIPIDALAEGEKDKVIQSLKPTRLSDKPDNQTELKNKPEVEEEPEMVPFPSENPLSEDSTQDTPPTPVRHCAEEPLQCKYVLGMKKIS